jgi:hypothetical protein
VKLRAAFFALLAALSLLLVSGEALAHKPSDSYLALSFSGKSVGVRWDIALRDLDYAIGLDGAGNGAITWGEVRARRDEIARYAMGRLALRADGAGACVASSLDALEIVPHSDGTYAVLHFAAACDREPRAIDVDYELLFDVDPLHRGIARIDDGAGTRTAIFSADDRKQSFDRATLAPAKQLGAAVKLGITHIFEGIDHLLFLVALLIPSVLSPRGARAWEPVPRLKPALVDVLKIVTSFTLAHSITLTLSALEVLRLPSRLVESGIAVSVVLAALNNVWPVLRGERWAAAFALGLLHGFGFSATLMDMGLPRENLVLTLFGFNVGVEIGQACVVAAFVPLAFLVRGTKGYRWGALVAGSMVIAAVASVWLVERAFMVKIF